MRRRTTTRATRSATAADDVVRGYVDRLSEATTSLPPAERAELVDQIRGHLAAARADAVADGRTDDEALARTLTDELGSPESIAAEAGAVPPARGLRPVALEAATVALLALQWVVVPGVGWIVGVVLAVYSRRWTTGEKALAAALPVPVVLAALVAHAAVGAVGPGSAPTEVVIVVVAAVLGITATALQARHLLRAARGAPHRGPETA